MVITRKINSIPNCSGRALGLPESIDFCVLEVQARELERGLLARALRKSREPNISLERLQGRLPFLGLMTGLVSREPGPSWV